MGTVRWLVCAMLVVAPLAACDAGSSSDQAERACGFIDAALVQDATGQSRFENFPTRAESRSAGDDAPVLAIGKSSDGSPLERFSCLVTDQGGSTILQVGGRTIADDADRRALTRRSTEPSSGKGCRTLDEPVSGSACPGAGTTPATVQLVDDGRWVTVRLTPRPGVDSTPEQRAELAERIARSVAQAQ